MLRSCFFWRLSIFICKFSAFILSASLRVLVSGVTAQAFVLFLHFHFSYVCCFVWEMTVLIWYLHTLRFAIVRNSFHHLPPHLFLLILLPLSFPPSASRADLPNSPLPHRQTSFDAYALPRAQRTTSSTSAGNMKCSMWATADEIVLLELEVFGGF